MVCSAEDWIFFYKSVACQQSWPESGRQLYWGKLQERVYRNRIRDVD